MDTILLSDQEIFKIGNPIMDNLMEGSNEKNWEKHTKHFTPGSKSKFSEENLLSQCKKHQLTHGFFTTREFIGITHHPKYVNILWKQRMTKVKGEYLAILTLVKKDNNFFVIRCWVDLWEPS